MDWNPVGLVAIEGQTVGTGGAVQISEPGRRTGVTFLDDAASAGNRLAAEILDDGKTGGEIEGNDVGRREALFAQPMADRNKGLYVPSEFGDSAIGFAIAKRWPVRARRRIHQNGGPPVGFRQMLIASRRRIAPHEITPGSAPAAAFEKLVDRRGAREPRRERCHR